MIWLEIKPRLFFKKVGYAIHNTICHTLWWFYILSCLLHLFEFVPTLHHCGHTLVCYSHFTGGHYHHACIATHSTYCGLRCFHYTTGTETGGHAEAEGPNLYSCLALRIMDRYPSSGTSVLRTAHPNICMNIQLDLQSAVLFSYNDFIYICVLFRNCYL